MKVIQNVVLLRANMAWAILAAVVCISAAGLPLTGHRISTDSLDVSLLGLGGLMLPLSLPRYRKNPRISKTIGGAAALLLFSAAGTVLSYLVVATNAPLVDDTFATWDRVLGFNWLAFSTWLHDRPWLMTSLDVAYGSGLPQLIVVVVFLGISGRHARLEEFLRLYFVAALVVIAISGPFPAEGPWKYYSVDAAKFDLASQSHFELLRQGLMSGIPLGRATQGLVSMPSLHAATAILLMYAMRRTALFSVFVLLNAAMLVSTPVSGSHYLVDVIAGAALAGGLIAMDRLDRRRTNISRLADRHP
jgi:membrane-associated phospholipid phosphatase